MSFRKQGRVWKLGDDVPNDGGLMPLRFTLDQVYDLQELTRHCFEEWRPQLATQIKPGDFLVTGRNFAYGHPHVRGFLALKSLCIAGILAESMSRGPYRLTIYVGIPILCPCRGISEEVEEGDALEVDFETGHTKNLTSKRELWYEPLPKILLDIVKAGGGEAYTRRQLTSKE